MRIKKTSQYIEGGASISNVYGTSQSNGYSQEYMNNLLNNVDVITGEYITQSSSKTFSSPFAIAVCFISSNQFAIYGFRSGNVTTFLQNGSDISASASGTNYTITNNNTSISIRCFIFRVRS